MHNSTHARTHLLPLAADLAAKAQDDTKDIRRQQHYKHSDPTPRLSFEVFEERHPAVEPKPSEAQLNSPDRSFQSGRTVHSRIACCLMFGNIKADPAIGLAPCHPSVNRGWAGKSE
jgi:hypothetical protein